MAVQSSASSVAQTVTTNEPEIDTSEDHVASLYGQNSQTQPTNATLSTSIPEPAVATNNTMPPASNEQKTAASPTSISQFTQSNSRKNPQPELQRT
jgi:hypothetical protein